METIDNFFLYILIGHDNEKLHLVLMAKFINQLPPSIMDDVWYNARTTRNVFETDKIVDMLVLSSQGQRHGQTSF